MSLLVELFEFLKEYKHSCNELKKCSGFNKSKSNCKNGDISLFCINANYDYLDKELKDLMTRNDGNQLINLISSYQIRKNTIAIKLNRSLVIKSVLLEIFQSKFKYGSSEYFQNKTYKVSFEQIGSPLTQMRVKQAAQVISALVALGSGSTCTFATDVIRLSQTANSEAILVSPVSTAVPTVEADYYQFWRNILIAMSNHKDIDEETLCKLTNAAVVFDLLSVKLNKQLVLDFTQVNLKKKSNKGAIFVLYNYVRACLILERFEYLVQSDAYKPLVSVHEVDCNLLSGEDEWVLVYDLLSKWPSVIIDAQNLTQPMIHRITAFLSSLALTFSVYYRHTRVLTDGLNHLIPLIHARVHLLMAVKQVFLNAFSLLGICPPRTM